jgi:Glyoxalase-like domain
MDFRWVDVSSASGAVRYRGRMHRSRLGAIGIDCPGRVRGETEAFWAGAMGGQVEREDEPQYSAVATVAGRWVFVQEIDGDARMHVDIETDDVEAEVARLEALGARRERQLSGYWIMRDPAGLVFCVVPPQTADFPGDAAVWP